MPETTNHSPTRVLPTSTEPALRQALEEARTYLEDIYGDRLSQVILYGSRARGESTAESDVDVLVVIKGPIENRYQEIKRAGSLWGELLSRYGLYFSFTPYTEEEYEDLRRPFIQNVRAEGIKI